MSERSIDLRYLPGFSNVQGCMHACIYKMIYLFLSVLATHMLYHAKTWTASMIAIQMDFTNTPKDVKSCI